MNRITINTEEAGEVKLKDHVRGKYTRQYQKHFESAMFAAPYWRFSLLWQWSCKCYVYSQEHLPTMSSKMCTLFQYYISVDSYLLNLG